MSTDDHSVTVRDHVKLTSGTRRRFKWDNFFRNAAALRRGHIVFCLTNLIPFKIALQVFGMFCMTNDILNETFVVGKR